VISFKAKYNLNTMSPFSLGKNELAKLDVLETKFNMYEDLSRQMIDKLELAVDKISEANNRIATILTKHDERIDQTLKNDEHFSKQLDELKKENKEDHNKVMGRIEKIENKLEEFIKFRWIVVGAAVVVSVILTVSSQSSIIVDFLQPDTRLQKVVVEDK
jgi:methyl-accepting chemotaxis protein